MLVSPMLTRQEALQLVDHYISSADKRKHVIVVSAIMKSLAEAIGANEDESELVGLMHDLDYDLVKGDMRRHGLVAAEMLEGKLPESCLMLLGPMTTGREWSLRVQSTRHSSPQNVSRF